jgi:peptide alpha-N-acetyltransferase
LETELSNKKALQFYERLGFIRDKRLTSYYLNGMDAFRLKLILRRAPTDEDEDEEETDEFL